MTTKIVCVQQPVFRSAPDGVERVGCGGGYEGSGEAACKGRQPILGQQVEDTELQSHVRRNAWTHAHLILGLFILLHF
jgi:hypothetical protein